MEWSLNSIAKNSRMRGSVLFVTIVMSLFFFVSCTSGSSKGNLEFYYYPQKNVYYDPVKKSFLYSLNGAKSWNTFSVASNTEPVTLGEKVLVYSKNTEVYRDNESHRKSYGGTLYNITIIDTGIAAMQPVAIERKTAQKRKVTVKRSANRKSENGIGKFINKIFGKHQ